MHRYFLWSILFFLLASCGPAIKEDEYLLASLMKGEPSKFQYILDHANSLEVQIIYTQINRGANNRPTFKSFYFRVDSNTYFYPASTVKLPLVLLALEKLNTLDVKGLNKFTPVFHDSVYSGQQAVRHDSTSENGLPSIGHYAKKILLVSDNDASNRLYEFMGQRAANEKLWEKGYDLRLLHRLERFLTPDENRHTEAVRFISHDTLIYSQAMQINKDSIRPKRKVLKGSGYLKNDVLVNQPFDFTYKNLYHLQNQQDILKSIIFPTAVDPQRRFNLSAEDRLFVLRYMSQLPPEAKYPAYKNDTAVYDAYCKFLMFGAERTPIPSHIRIFNKVGDAYGCLIDNAYIVDFDNGVEFILSAVINVNLDGIYNDNKYDYKTVGFPFMKNLGQLIYQYELQRKRERSPDLQEFKFNYDE